MLAEPLRPGRRIARRSPRRRASPPRLLVVSFAGLIALGWIGLLWLPGLTVGPPLGWVDALFMAASAVCVTGLSVIDVSSRLTAAGQAWILLLIQLGGLGMLTFAGLVVSLLGGRSSLVLEEASSSHSPILPAQPVARMLRLAVGATLVVELVGAALLWIAWRGEMGAGRAAWYALFHAVSAFCNAGFSLFPDSLVGFRDQAGLLATIAALVVIGGIGFPVIEDLRGRLRGRRRRTTLHTRLVLVTTAIVVAVSAAGYLVFEWDHALAPLGPVDRAVNAAFMAITPRTAGFNTVDYGSLTNEALFLTLGLMWVGGGPASIAGGVKVTTVTLLAMVLWARLRGESHVSIGGRTVPAETVQRAGGLAAGGLLLLGLFVFAILATEPAVGDEVRERLRLVHLLFEVQSALSTVGLSMGVTPELAPASRLLLVFVMFLGRVGPLALLGAMAVRRIPVRVRFAHEDVLIG